MIERLEQKEIWLKLADNYLRNSGNEFLSHFGAYLEKGYRGANNCAFSEQPQATKQQILLKKMLDFEAFCLPDVRVKGFALIGKTGFNKAELIKNYFVVCGLTEFSGNETGGCYAVADCSAIKSYGSLIKTLVKYQDVTYVIFDNCDSLLKNDGALQAFKHLSEDFPGLTIIKKNDEAVNFKTDSRFVFLGEENTLYLAIEKEISKGLGASAYNHFDAFIHYIHVYDFDKGERYYGHDVAPVYS
jgi:hypothetical protein